MGCAELSGAIWAEEALMAKAGWIFAVCLTGVQSCFCREPLFSFGIHFLSILSLTAQMGLLLWGWKLD